MTTRTLHLRTPKFMPDVSAQLSHHLWNDLTEKRGIFLNPHLYVSFEHTVREVLSAHVKNCEARADESCWGAWSQTEGSIPGHHIRAEICKFHEVRLLSESKEAVEELLTLLSSAVHAFILAREKTSLHGKAVKQEKILPAIRNVIVSYLVKNLGSSRCDKCTD